MLGFAALVALALAAGDGGSAGPAPVDGGAAPSDGGARPDAKPDGGTADGGADAGAAADLPSLPPVREPPGSPVASSHRRGKSKSGKEKRQNSNDLSLEGQNQLVGVARRYVQLLMSRRFDEARLLHEEEGGRRPDWSTLRGTAASFLDAHGAPRNIDQSLTTYTGSELTTFFFTAVFPDKSELPLRVAVDHWGHVSGAGVGPEAVPATRKRYDRHDDYKTRTELSLPFAGAWMASNATLAPGNGHYLNANQRFAIDFLRIEEDDGNKRKTHRERGKQNSDYFAYGQDVLAPADGVVVQAVDGIPDNTPGQVDVYYRLGNSVVISFENGEYAHLCHLMTGSVRVRPGDRVQRGQVVAKCGNSGNSTGPHLHFQLTDGPLISYASSLPAWFRGIRKNGVVQPEVLPQSGDRLENAPPRERGLHATAEPDPSAEPKARRAKGSLAP